MKLTDQQRESIKTWRKSCGGIVADLPFSGTHYSDGDLYFIGLNMDDEIIEFIMAMAKEQAMAKETANGTQTDV